MAEVHPEDVRSGNPEIAGLDVPLFGPLTYSVFGLVDEKPSGAPEALAMDNSMAILASTILLHEGDEEALHSIRSTISTHAKNCPSPVWDRQRQLLARTLLAGGRQTEAIQIAGEMDDPHRIVDFIIPEAEPDFDIFKIRLTQFLETCGADRSVELARAIRDHYIKTNPSVPFNDELTFWFKEANIETDPVDGWVESQSIEYPAADWESIAVFVREDELWDGQPLTIRQHLVMFCLSLGATPDTQLPDDPTGYNPRLAILLKKRADYAVLPFWELVFSATCQAMIHNGDLDDAASAAGHLDDDRFLLGAAVEFARAGHPRNALHFAIDRMDETGIISLLEHEAWTNCENADAILFETIECMRQFADMMPALLEYVNYRLYKNKLFVQSAAIALRLNRIRLDVAGSAS